MDVFVQGPLTLFSEVDFPTFRLSTREKLDEINLKTENFGIRKPCSFLW